MGMRMKNVYPTFPNAAGIGSGVPYPDLMAPAIDPMLPDSELEALDAPPTTVLDSSLTPIQEVSAWDGLG